MYTKKKQTRIEKKKKKNRKKYMIWKNKTNISTLLQVVISHCILYLQIPILYIASTPVNKHAYFL